MKTVPQAMRDGLADAAGLRAAIDLFRAYIREPPNHVDARRLAVRLGFGASPRAAAYREWQYRQARRWALLGPHGSRAAVSGSHLPPGWCPRAIA